jgi:hypothetical protein
MAQNWHRTGKTGLFTALLEGLKVLAGGLEAIEAIKVLKLTAIKVRGRWRVKIARSLGKEMDQSDAVHSLSLPSLPSFSSFRSFHIHPPP